MRMVGQVFGKRLFYEHGSVSIWPETFMSILLCFWGQ